MAQNRGPAALTGTVSSREEGKMEGVVVSAKRPGSTIMVSVSTNAQGQYSFPQDRLAPGDYDITMRAVGYTLHADQGNDTIGRRHATRPQAREGHAGRSRPANDQQRVDSKRAGHARPENGIAEMSRLSWPAASDLFQGRCVGNGVHGAAHDRAQRECFSQFSFLPSERIRDLEPSAEPRRWRTSAAYIASINLSSGETWPYKLKTQPRPTGKSTQAIITTYDLPDGAAPHDTLLDKAGNVWFSDFQHHFISKLDPKTGKVTRYPVPISKPGFPTGGLMITMDKDGNIWEGMMGQAQIAMLDPKTEKVSIYLAPDWDKGDTRFTMIDALHSNVDGKLWTKTNGGPDPDHANKLYQFDLATKKFNEVLPPAGKRDIAAYGLVTDLDNNVYGLDNNPAQRQIWRTNAKTGETTYIDLPIGVGGARRGHIDSQNRLWFSQFHANRYARYDAKTRNITVWDVPVPYAGAYDVQFDDVEICVGRRYEHRSGSAAQCGNRRMELLSPAHVHQHAPYRRAEE